VNLSSEITLGIAGKAFTQKYEIQYLKIKTRLCDVFHGQPKLRAFLTYVILIEGKVF